MKASELKSKYIAFFVKKGHKELANVSLVPENDSSALFISAGMHPLVPYLLGKPHPLGKQLCNVQRCLRTVDIENVGDGFHHTFFEMLGNWSLGDYWKRESITYSWEFLTKELGISAEKVSVSCFKGNQDVPRDEESAKIWQGLGVPKEKIFFLGKKDNWWGPVAETGPCGPDTEIFFDTGKKKCGSDCDVSCQCGKYIEIWNNVFMQYNRTVDGKYEPLKQKNVDTGMGVDRVTAILSGFGSDDYRTELFWPIIQEIEKITGKKYGDHQKAMRIIADHLRAAVFLISDSVLPSNVEQGYVLRRLIRRAIRYGRGLGLESGLVDKVSVVVIETMKDSYPQLEKKKKEIRATLKEEKDKFSKALTRGLREIEKHRILDGKIAFQLYETYGIPLEMTEEIAQEREQKLDKQIFKEEFKRHQALSRKSAGKKFSGGLAGHSKQVIKLHTATHLLHQALRQVLGDHVRQVGSNITPERLRFDFTHSEKLTDKQIKKIEKIVNEKIKANLVVKMEMMGLEEAKKMGALAFFKERYGDQIKVYSVGDFSKEICAGPHVDSTAEVGGVRINKEESIGAGRRRIYAVLAHGS